MRFAPAGLRPPVGVLGLEQPAGLFDSRGVQIQATGCSNEKGPVVGASILMVVEEGFEPPTLCL